MLHLAAFAPSRSDLLDLLSQACAEGDQLVLLEDAALFCRPEALARLTGNLPRVALHVLDSGLRQAGLTHAPAQVSVIDQQALVELTEAHSPIASWYP